MEPVTYQVLDRIESAADVRALPRAQLPELCAEVRSCLIETVSKTAGHLASGLGVVELTVALHYVYNTPHDVLVWDVGHQAYPHKILTGHRKEFATIRQHGGLHAFIWRGETPYDLLCTGHASTSIGSALGIAVAERNKPDDKRRKVVAIIGDGALSGGCAFEALNHAGSFQDRDVDLTVILNDNEMSISENVGGLAQGLSHILASPHYVKLVEGGMRILKSLPTVRNLALRAQEHAKGMIMPGTLFEEFGFNYIGPIDGHDVDRLVTILQNVRKMKGLTFLHVVTTKGKGYAPAERDPICYHGVPTFNPIEGIAQNEQKEDCSYSAAFGRWMCDKAETDRKLMAVTPAMRIGSGLSEFAAKYPHQFFDVAIAEQHAMVFASGLAAGGMRPVINIYSSFMQRAYDGLIHDMAVQNLPMVLCLDRGGVVGPDGPTHNGSFDIAYTRAVPNLVIMAPASRHELYTMLSTGYALERPVVIRYPRTSGESFKVADPCLLKTLKGRAALFAAQYPDYVPRWPELQAALASTQDPTKAELKLQAEPNEPKAELPAQSRAALLQQPQLSAPAAARLNLDARIELGQVEVLHQNWGHLVELLQAGDTQLLPLMGLTADPSLIEPYLMHAEVRALAAALQEQQAQGAPRVAVLAFGPVAYELYEECAAADYTLLNMRFIKPLNEELIAQLARDYDLLVTVEEGARLGGIGEHISALVAQELSSRAHVFNLGLHDAFIMEGTRAEILAEQGLSVPDIMAEIAAVTAKISG